MKIEVGKFYRTRSGNKVRIYALDGGGHYQVHGAIEIEDDDNHWDVQSWSINGTWNEVLTDHSFDIVSEWHEPIKVSGWVASFPLEKKLAYFSQTIFPTREQCLAAWPICMPIYVTGTEGKEP